MRCSGRMGLAIEFSQTALLNDIVPRPIGDSYDVRRVTYLAIVKHFV